MFSEFTSLPKPTLSNPIADKNQSTKKAPSPGPTFFHSFPLPNLGSLPTPNLSGLSTHTQKKSAKPRNANLKDLFQTDELNNIEVITRPMPMRKLPSDRKYTLYPLQELMTLVNEAFAKQDQDPKKKSKEVITLRYVVTKNFDILFAREGNPSTYVPAHREMTPDYTGRNCLAAGNIKTNRQGEIKFINNKSGDLTPEFIRVAIALAILHLKKELLPRSLPENLIVLRASDQQSYSVASAQLPDLVTLFSDETVEKMKIQPTKCITRDSTLEQTNLSKRERPNEFVTPRAARRSIFDIKSPLEPKKTSSENNSLEDKENINPMSL